MDKFSELKAAAMAATQGAWERGWDNDTGPNDNYFVEWQTAGPASFYKDNAENDADFASNATPETILALLAELEFEKQNNAGVAGMVEDYETKLAEKDKRISELERANQSQDDHINQQQDRIDSLEKTNAGLGRRLGDAEKRLATPVQLQNCDFESVAIMAHWCTDEQLKAWVKGVEHAKKQIRAAGFKVEGEQ
ncbi:ead/Ea22-like family protein [Serratia marcescens]|uniref:ead/Ea22-like family protein n=1 Tax=Serratia marcescens TaxID=615 RepID=UPI001495891C|nr:ead/Ea22-like family protein [Serratia marcescens]